MTFLAMTKMRYNKAHQVHIQSSFSNSLSNQQDSENEGGGGGGGEEDDDDDGDHEEEEDDDDGEVRESRAKRRKLDPAERVMRRRDKRLWHQRRKEILFNYMQFSFYSSSVLISQSPSLYPPI